MLSTLAHITEEVGGAQTWRKQALKRLWGFLGNSEAATQRIDNIFTKVVPLLGDCRFLKLEGPWVFQLSLNHLKMKLSVQLSSGEKLEKYKTLDGGRGRHYSVCFLVSISSALREKNSLSIETWISLLPQQKTMYKLRKRKPIFPRHIQIYNYLRS